MPDPLSFGQLTLTLEQPAVPSKPPLLFVHGMFGGAWNFEPYQRFFAARGYPAYALNLRGHFDSRPVADIGRVSVRDYVVDAIDAVAEIGRRHPGPAPLIAGHSMGGLIAQKVAEAGAVSAAVLLCSAPPRGIPVLGATLLRRMIKPRYLGPLLFSRPIVGAYEDNVALSLSHFPPGERRALHDRFVPESGRAGREISLGSIAVDASRVRCPVLSVAASHDAFVVPRVGRRLAEKYRAPYLEFAGHAHFVICEPGWETPAAEIGRWLDDALGAD